MSCFYCCGKPAAVKLMHSAADYTTSKPDKVKDDCCKSKSISLKLKDAHVYAVSFSLNHPSPVLISSFNSLDNDAPAKIFDSKMAYSGDRPPGYSKIPIYIQYCIYRI